MTDTPTPTRARTGLADVDRRKAGYPARHDHSVIPEIGDPDLTAAYEAWQAAADALAEAEPVHQSNRGRAQRASFDIDDKTGTVEAYEEAREADRLATAAYHRARRAEEAAGDVYHDAYVSHPGVKAVQARRALAADERVREAWAAFRAALSEREDALTRSGLGRSHPEHWSKSAPHAIRSRGLAALDDWTAVVGTDPRRPAFGRTDAEALAYGTDDER